jgi:3-hydroxyacyl-CoA dehydrogenase/3-hydroxy-2-methylbutyryl-CoA dehydrogenase
MKIENSVVLVTGGASGIGENIASYLSSKGAIVYTCDLQDNNDKINKANGGVKYIKCDVSNEEQVKSMIEKIKSEQGRLDIVVNNAGIGYGEYMYSKSQLHSTEGFERTWRINTLGVFLVSKYAAKLMIENCDKSKDCNGVFILIASVAGIDSSSGSIAYGSSKAAVIGMTTPFAREMAKYKIRVNTIAPGFIQTPMFSSIKGTPFHKKQFDSILVGKPIHISQTCEYLIVCDFVNGAVIKVDNLMLPKY